MIQLHISKGNSKIGGVPSVSFPPHVTCAPGVPCFKLCYAYRLSRIRKSVQAAWQRNLDLWNEDKRGFERQLTVFLETTPSRYFRWFVAGDIPDAGFLRLMIRTAKKFPAIKFMVYTKWWRKSNRRLIIADLPNLVVRLSTWPNSLWEKPLSGWPFSAMIPKGADILPGSIECPGECGPCGYKCWDRDVNVSIRQH